MSAPKHEERADGGTIERVVRKFRLGDEPSQVAEYAHFTVDERLQMFLRLRQRVIKDCYGTDPGFERVYSVARRS